MQPESWRRRHHICVVQALNGRHRNGGDAGASVKVIATPAVWERL